MRDLEIRGAGNLLGPEQSGHITAVGFELYCQLLKHSVGKLKGETARPEVEVQVRLDFLATQPARRRRVPAHRLHHRAATAHRDVPQTGPSRRCQGAGRVEKGMARSFRPAARTGRVGLESGRPQNRGRGQGPDHDRSQRGQIDAQAPRRFCHGQGKISALAGENAGGAAQGNQEGFNTPPHWTSPRWTWPKRSRNWSAWPRNRAT
jgi:hypothetical protein